MDLLKFAESQIMETRKFPEFKAGDTVTISYKIKEGDNERVQQFSGVCLQRKGVGNVN